MDQTQQELPHSFSSDYTIPKIIDKLFHNIFKIQASNNWIVLINYFIQTQKHIVLTPDKYYDSIVL